MPEADGQRKDGAFLVPAGQRAVAKLEVEMVWDDLPEKKPAGAVLGEDLSKLSVGELEKRVHDLRAEIARVEAEIFRKQKIGAAAEQVFRR